MEPLEPLKLLNFEVLCKIDLYTDLYIVITSGTSGTSRTSMSSIFEKRFLLAGIFGTYGTSRTCKFSIF